MKLLIIESTKAKSDIDYFKSTFNISGKTKLKCKLVSFADLAPYSLIPSIINYPITKATTINQLNNAINEILEVLKYRKDFKILQSINGKDFKKITTKIRD